MDTPSDLRTLRFYAERLHELEDPKLTLSELQNVLKWELIPTSASHIYDYALTVQMFLHYLEKVDPNSIDNKTEKLIKIALKRIRVSTEGDGRLGTVFTSIAGVSMAYCIYYYLSSAWFSIGTSVISMAVAIFWNMNIADAQDRNALSRTSRQLETFADSQKHAMKLILITEYSGPVTRYIWAFLKGHPWLSIGIILLSPVIYGIVFDPHVKAWWIDALLLLEIYVPLISDWFNLGFVQVLGILRQALRRLIQATKVHAALRFMLYLLFRRSSLRTSSHFVYPPYFEHASKIRLLRVSHKLPFLPVEASIFEVNDDELLHVHSYDAVSHVWGDEPRSEQILVDVAVFPVTPSVYNILYQCSSYFGDRLVWIDNICINQDADPKEEKESQIQKMRGIYDHAREVQVFFVGSPSAWLAIPFMYQLLIGYGGPKDKFSNYMISMLLRAKRDAWLRAKIDALLDLLGNSYLERAWIVQEFVVAAKITVHYSGSTFDWEKLILLAGMLEDEEVPEAAHFLMSGGNKPGTELKTWIKRPILMDQWRKQVLFERYFKISEALSSFCSSKATVWQDKIFAFVGFTDRTEELSHIINYSISKEEILLTLAHHILKRDGILPTLPFAGLTALPTNVTNLPTWVADWTTTRRTNPIVAPKSSPYNASAQDWDRVEQGESQREIIVHGVIIDNIKTISIIDLDVTPDGGTIRSAPIETLSKAMDFFAVATALARGLVSDPYQPTKTMNQPLDEVVSRTMFGDSTKKTRPAPEEYSDLIMRFLEHGSFMKDRLETGKFTMEDIHPLPWGDGAYHGEWWREAEIRTLMRQIDNVRWLCGDGRKFGITEKQFIGMFPNVVVEGDLVCLIYGSPTPMILRKCSFSDSYQLVGEAYVHGFMDGEGKHSGVEQEFTIV